MCGQFTTIRKKGTYSFKDLILFTFPLNYIERIDRYRENNREGIDIARVRLKGNNYRIAIGGTLAK